MDPEDAVLLDRLTALRIPDDLEHRFRRTGTLNPGCGTPIPVIGNTRAYSGEV